MTLNVAVAGTGYFSRFHYDAWSRLHDVRIVGAASHDPKGLQDVGKSFRINQLYDDVGVMLDQARPDLLDIITPPSTHEALLEQAAARGVNVVCQKPLGGNLETAQNMVKRAEESGIVFAIHENFRFQPWYRETRRMIDQGRLGDISNVSFRLRPGDGQGAGAYLDRQPYFQRMKRFLVHETAIHFIDSFRYLFGEVAGVFAHLRQINPVIEGEDAGHLMLAFTSGAIALFDGNRLLGFPAKNPRLTMGEFLAEGTGGSLRLDGDGRLWYRPHDGVESEHAYAWEDRSFGGDCVRALQAHVLAHLREGRPLENSGRDYLTNLEIEEAIYRSAETGRFLDLTAQTDDGVSV